MELTAQLIVPVGIWVLGSNVIFDNVAVEFKLQVVLLTWTSPAAEFVQAVQLLPSETKSKVEHFVHTLDEVHVAQSEEVVSRPHAVHVFAVAIWDESVAQAVTHVAAVALVLLRNVPVAHEVHNVEDEQVWQLVLMEEQVPLHDFPVASGKFPATQPVHTVELLQVWQPVIVLQAVHAPELKK